jgi:hypothetical protein
MRGLCVGEFVGRGERFFAVFAWTEVRRAVMLNFRAGAAAAAAAAAEAVLREGDGHWMTGSLRVLAGNRRCTSSYW